MVPNSLTLTIQQAAMPLMTTPAHSPAKARSHFLKYALGLTSVSAATSASAGIVSWDSGNATGDGLTLSGENFFFTPTTGVTGSSGTLQLFTSPDNFLGQASSGYFFLGSTHFQFYSAGQSIDGSAGNTTFAYSGDPISGTSYIGFAIDQGSSNYQYGWAAVQWTPNAGSAPVTLVAFGYETDLNTAIQAGATAVPEPAQAAWAVAAGAVGFAALRRRKRQTETVN